MRAAGRGCLTRLIVIFTFFGLITAINIALVKLQLAPQNASALFWTIGISVLASSVWAAVAVNLAARRRLQANRLELMRIARICPVCNYNLKTMPAACPECGTLTQTLHT